MQMRFDGYLGFPGGLIDEGEDPVFSLNRELKEEMALDLSKYSVKNENYIVSHYNGKNNLGLHFYALEVTMSDIKNIETQALNAEDYGIEVRAISTYDDRCNQMDKRNIVFLLCILGIGYCASAFVHDGRRLSRISCIFEKPVHRKFEKTATVYD